MFERAIDGTIKSVKQMYAGTSANATQEYVSKPPATVSILMLGRYGCGKSLFVNSVAGRGFMRTQPTSTTNSTSVRIKGQKYRLFDTPGLDNPAIGDTDLFEGIARFILEEPRCIEGITGAVYIHRAEDYLESRTLSRNLQVLQHALLGDSWLSRLTIMVIPNSFQPCDKNQLASSISQPISAFHAVSASGAQTRVSSLDVDSISTLLSDRYALLEPAPLSIQVARPSLLDSNRLSLIQKHLGDSNNHTTERQLEDQKIRLRSKYQGEIHTLEDSLSDTRENLNQALEELKQTEDALRTSQADEKKFRERLDQTQSEYASLRSQLQLRENFEQGTIVRSLKDLNRRIDDLGRSISAFMVDTYVQKTFGDNIETVTTLRACQLPELKNLLAHKDGCSSLVASSRGIGMGVEDFFDYAIRSLLCNHLCTKIFSPFHPGAEKSQNDVVSAMYLKIRQQEPQPIAAKWRSNSFKSIYNPDHSDETTRHIASLVDDFLHESLAPLIFAFFGRVGQIKMASHNFDQLKALIRMSWDWNSVLKGDVITLGDFSQVSYDPSSPFDSIFMNEFEPNSKRPPPKAILGTLALGLISSRAVGGGRSPETEVIYRAVVATESLYD